jgi:hypothetical protein
MKNTNINFISKKTLLNFSALLILLVFSGNMFAQKKSPDKILANKTYTIEIIQQGKKGAGDPEADEINFKSDKLTSKLMKTDYEFNAGAYTVEVDSSASEGASISFESEGKNSGGESLKWTGTVKGEEVEGTAVITNKKGKVKMEFTFTGTLKGKKKK